MERTLDQEWVYLIIEAKQLGIPLEEVRRFLQQSPLTEILHQEKQPSFDFD